MFKALYCLTGAVEQLPGRHQSFTCGATDTAASLATEPGAKLLIRTARAPRERTVKAFEARFEVWKYWMLPDMRRRGLMLLRRHRDKTEWTEWSRPTEAREGQHSGPHQLHASALEGSSRGLREGRAPGPRPDPIHLQSSYIYICVSLSTDGGTAHVPCTEGPTRDYQDAELAATLIEKRPRG